MLNAIKVSAWNLTNVLYGQITRCVKMQGICRHIYSDIKLALTINLNEQFTELQSTACRIDGIALCNDSCRNVLEHLDLFLPICVLFVSRDSPLLKHTV